MIKRKKEIYLYGDFVSNIVFQSNKRKVQQKYITENIKRTYKVDSWHLRNGRRFSPNRSEITIPVKRRHVFYLTYITIWLKLIGSLYRTATVWLSFINTFYDHYERLIALRLLLLTRESSVDFKSKRTFLLFNDSFTLDVLIKILLRSRRDDTTICSRKVSLRFFHFIKQNIKKRLLYL